MLWSSSSGSMWCSVQAQRSSGKPREREKSNNDNNAHWLSSSTPGSYSSLCSVAPCLYGKSFQGTCQFILKYSIFPLNLHQSIHCCRSRGKDGGWHAHSFLCWMGAFCPSWHTLPKKKGVVTSNATSEFLFLLAFECSLLCMVHGHVCVALPLCFCFCYSKLSVHM